MLTSALADYRYLVVEDDALVSALVAGMLNKAGAAKVEIAENGRLALDRLEAGGDVPDIIISDLSMPQLDGVEFMRHLAEKRFAGGIVLISSSDKRFLRTVVNLGEAYHLNVLGALGKPFTPTALRNLLMQFAGAKKMPGRLPLPPSIITPDSLCSAIEHDQLLPFFQPKVSARTGAVIGVEALARWRHPEHGLIPPGLFIPMAEKHGLIGLLTQDMLLKTLQQAAIWHKHHLPFSFAINFSAMSLSDVDLPDRLEAELARVGISPAYLTLEMTESGLCENLALCLETVLRLRLKGIHLSIDDFGTGHSSLEQLHRIPFSELKIDRIFVNGAGEDEDAGVFLQTVVALAKKLGLSIVAEGVETQADLDICARLDCNVIQGYFTGRPMAGDAFLDWHQNRANPVRPEARRHE